MRPQSIIMFERLFLASLAVSVLSFVLSYRAVMDTVSRDLQGMGVEPGFVLALVGIGYAIYLLLWYLIAHKAANWAKWVLIVFLALSLVSLPAALAGPWTLTTLLGLSAYALEVVAAVYLFRADAKAWLTGQAAIDPATFD